MSETEEPFESDLERQLAEFLVHVVECLDEFRLHGGADVLEPQTALGNPELAHESPS